MGSIAKTETGLSRYFTREAVLLALIIGVLPNLFFLAVMPFYIAHRMLSPILYLAAGLVSLAVPRWVSFGALLGVAVIDVLLMMMLAFNLPLDATLQSARELNTINVGASFFYMAFIGGVAGMAALTAYLIGRNKPALRKASPVLAALVALSFVGLNQLANGPYLAKFDGQPDGALRQLGLTAGTIEQRETNLVIVMVEGLGAFADPAERSVLQDKLTAAGPGHTLQAGTSHYHGSTTGAASRELCGRWGDFTDYLGAPRYNCLPRQLAERGMETVAIHGFDIDMFRRDLWYPRIGFTQLKFKDDLIAEYGAHVPGRCGSVFYGLCDPELASVVKAELNDGEDPKMIYWLTLNSHIPFAPKTDGALACGSSKAPIDDKQVCELTELWGDVFDAVAALAADPDLPPTDFVIVGDHHTPFWDRGSKNKFTLNKVDWYYLADKRAVGSPTQLALQP